MFKKIKALFTCNYNLGRALPPKKWENYYWTAQDRDEFYKKFEHRVKKLDNKH